MNIHAARRLLKERWNLRIKRVPATSPAYNPAEPVYYVNGLELATEQDLIQEAANLLLTKPSKERRSFPYA